LTCEAEDVDTVQQGENISRNDLVKEHSRECHPEELDTFGIGIGVEMQCYIYIGSVNRLGRIPLATNLGTQTRLEGSIAIF